MKQQNYNKIKSIIQKEVQSYKRSDQEFLITNANTSSKNKKKRIKSTKNNQKHYGQKHSKQQRGYQKGQSEKIQNLVIEGANQGTFNKR